MRTIRKKRRMFRLLKDAFRTAGADKIISGYFLWFFISAVPIWLGKIFPQKFYTIVHYPKKSPDNKSDYRAKYDRIKHK